jgi:hypothetical protein
MSLADRHAAHREGRHDWSRIRHHPGHRKNRRPTLFVDRFGLVRPIFDAVVTHDMPPLFISTATTLAKPASRINAGNTPGRASNVPQIGTRHLTRFRTGRGLRCRITAPPSASIGDCEFGSAPARQATRNEAIMVTNSGKFVCYFRVLTARQGKSGLGLDRPVALLQHPNRNLAPLRSHGALSGRRSAGG